VPESTAHTTQDRRALRQRSRALQQLRSEAGYTDRDRHHSAVAALQRTLSLSPGRARPELADYHDPEASPLRHNDLLGAAEDPSSSPYHQTFASLAARVVAEQPRVVGISINYLHQALPAMTLAGMLRRALPREVPVVAGGGLIHCWHRQLGPQSLAPAIDHLVFSAGEAPLLALLGHHKKPARDGIPSFSDVPWPLYLAPRPVLPVSTSTGCYWKRCRYCPEATEGERFKPNRAPLGEIFARITAQIAAHKGPGLVHLTDSAIPPRTLREASELGALHLGETIPWYGFARIHKDLTDEEFCQRLKRGGCAMLQLGLESGSPQTLARLNKGIVLAEASRALHALGKAGIATYVYVMFGVPGEDRDQAQLTLRFVADHASVITFLNVSLLNLPHASPAEETLQTRDLETDRDLSLYTGFDSDDGWQRREARAFMDKSFAREPAVAAILRRTPHIFGASHAAFFALNG